MQAEVIGGEIMREKEAREITSGKNLPPAPLIQRAFGYLEGIEKAKTYLWMALMDIAVDTEHKCQCQCANHRIDRAQEALDRWKEER